MRQIATILGASTLALLTFTVSPSARAADATTDTVATNTTAKVTPVDALFAREAAASNQAEIKLSDKVKDHATTPAVKEFAQRMVDDHTKATNQLKQITDNMDISLPGDMDSAHSSFGDTLDGLKGADYERAYIQAMIMDHQMAIALFENEAKHGNTMQLKNFAQQTLPILQQHLTEAERVQKELTPGEAAGANKDND